MSKFAPQDGCSVAHLESGTNKDKVLGISVLHGRVQCAMVVREREREREREIHYVHSASLAYEDGIVFMSEPSAARQ